MICKQLWMGMESKPLHNCMFCSPALWPKLSVDCQNLDQQLRWYKMLMVLYAHPLHMKWFQHIIWDPHWCTSSDGWVWSLNNCLMVWFVAQHCDPSFQPTVKIWINKGGGNGMPMVPYTHPLHMKRFQHLICAPHWCASSFGWVWSLNHCTIVWFVAQHCDPSFQPTAMDQHGQW